MAVYGSNTNDFLEVTPLADVLLTVDAEGWPVTPRTIEDLAATGRALAADALARSRPASALALQDGWALNSDETLGAGGDAPSPLVRTPVAHRGWSGASCRDG